VTELYNAFIKTEEENQKYDGARVSLDYAESHKLSNAQKDLCLAAKMKSRDLTSTLTAMKRKVNLFADFQKEIMQLNHLSDIDHSKDLMGKKRKDMMRRFMNRKGFLIVTSGVSAPLSGMSM